LKIERGWLNSSCNSCPSEVSNLRENGGAVQVKGFVHSNTVTYIETIIRWIQHPHVLDQHWTPLKIAAATHHWRQQDAIVQMFSNWDSSCGKETLLCQLGIGHLMQLCAGRCGHMRAEPAAPQHRSESTPVN